MCKFYHIKLKASVRKEWNSCCLLTSERICRFLSPWQDYSHKRAMKSFCTYCSKTLFLFYPLQAGESYTVIQLLVFYLSFFLLFFPSLHAIAKWSGVPEKFLVSDRLSFPVSLSETIRVRNHPLKTPGTERSFCSRKKQKTPYKCISDAS